MVGAIGGEEEELAGRVVDGSNDGDVGQMRAAGVGIVGREDVARLHVWIGRDDLPHGFFHRAEVDGNVGRVGHEPAVGREDGAAEVEPFLDVDAAGGVAERDAHLIGDGGELVVEDFEEDGVGGIADCGLRIADCGLGGGMREVLC